MTTAFAPTVPLRTTPFIPTATSPLAHALISTSTPRHATISMVSQSNIAVKAAKVADVKQRLENSQLIFNASLDGLTVGEVSQLKQSMPAGTSIATVKNSLMRRAIVDSEWAPAEQLTKNSSLWVFVEDDMKASVKAYNTFIKGLKREAPIVGGVFDGEYYDGEGIDTVSKLPTKQELMQQVAASIKMVPTKLGRSVKAVPSKLGRAIKLATSEDDADGADAPAE